MIINNKTLFLALIPALLIVSGIFAFKMFQYTALFGADEEPVATLDLIPIDLKKDPIIGPSNAPITVVAFEDLACEGCKAQNTILKTLQETHPGKVKIIWKGLPIIPFPYPSEVAHEYAFCAEKQGKFVEFKDFAFANNNNLSPATLKTIVTQIELDEELLQTCLDSDEGIAYIDTIRSLARLLNVQSVPTFFVHNKQITTPDSVSGWEATLGL